MIESGACGGDADVGRYPCIVEGGHVGSRQQCVLWWEGMGIAKSSAVTGFGVDWTAWMGNADELVLA